MKKYRVRCNNCDTTYFEYENEYIFECSICETDEFLMDIK